jgi:GGDEF domain-containing protein
MGTVEHLDEVIRSLEELSSKDHLPGAYNRRACEERLAEDLAQLERSGGSLMLAVLNLNGSKRSTTGTVTRPEMSA